MLWRVHPQTVNLVPPGKHSRFESVDTHQISPGDGIGIRVGLRSQILGVRVSSGAPISGLKVFMDARMPVTHKEGDRYPLGPPMHPYSSVVEQRLDKALVGGSIPPMGTNLALTDGVQKDK